MADPDEQKTDEQATDDERWLVVNGRRWRRADPVLPDDLAAALRSHLGAGRSAVKAGKHAQDEQATASARKRVGLAKHGLGERGPKWWEQPEDARIDRARQALRDLDEIAGPRPPRA